MKMPVQSKTDTWEILGDSFRFKIEDIQFLSCASIHIISFLLIFVPNKKLISITQVFFNGIQMSSCFQIITSQLFRNCCATMRRRSIWNSYQFWPNTKTITACSTSGQSCCYEQFTDKPLIQLSRFIFSLQADLELLLTSENMPKSH